MPSGACALPGKTSTAGWAFTVEEIDYLDTRAVGEARRDRLSGEDVPA